jgi:hypothetical protein
MDHWQAHSLELFQTLDANQDAHNSNRVSLSRLLLRITVRLVIKHKRSRLEAAK